MVVKNRAALPPWLSPLFVKDGSDHCSAIVMGARDEGYGGYEVLVLNQPTPSLASLTPLLCIITTIYLYNSCRPTRFNQCYLPNTYHWILTLLKKKLPLSWLFPLKDLAIVREIVDFPISAIPLSQNMHLLCTLLAHSAISRHSSTLVFSRHFGFCSSSWESKAAPTATGSLDRSIFWCISQSCALYRKESLVIEIYMMGKMDWWLNDYSIIQC